VFQVRKKDTGNIFAMKVIRKDNVVKRNAVEHTMAENKILKHINHPFLVNLKYAFQTKLHLYMVIDYLNGGELFYHLTRDDYFSEERTRFYAAEVVLALGYLHDNNIVYRDLKPENLLLDMQGHICLVDFGLCKTGLGFDTKTHTFCGSPEYIAPEVLRGEGYNKEVDWWALGTLIFEMLTGLPPFWSEDEDVMHNKIQYAPLQFPPNFSEAVKDLLRGLLNRNPKKRLGTGLDGTEDIKKHAWFNTLNWRKLYNREAEPPFKPHITNMLDLNYFDEEFTREAPQLSYTGTPGFKFDQDIFSGFSYNGESEMRNFGDHPMPPSSLSRNGALERRRRFSSANPPPPVGSVNARLKVAISNSFKNNTDMMESDYDEALEEKMMRMNSLPHDTMNITPVSSLGNSFTTSKSPQRFVQGHVASNNFQQRSKPQSPQRKMLIGVNKEMLSPRDDMDDMSEDDFDDENHTPSSQSNLMFALE
jgi:serine/threonine protein kinase